MNKRILHAAAVLAAVFACLFTAVTPANALNFNGSASGGGSGSASTNASGSYGLPAFVDSEYNAAPAYRFTVVDSSGSIKGASVDIYRSAYSKYMATGYHKFSTKYPKTVLKSLYSSGSFSTSATNTNCYIDTSLLGISLPTRTTGMEAWSTETNMSTLLTKAWGCSISTLEQNGWCILIEPIYPVKLEGQYHSLTVTEIAVYGAAKFGASTVPASGTNTDSWDWISNYTNRLYPNALRLSKDYVGLSAVSELSSRASFGTIITQGYGAAVVYGEYTSYHYLDVNGYLDGAEYGATTGYGTFDVYINGSLVADDVSDYWAKWPSGTTYSITDIKAATGKTYHWVHSGYQSGTIYSAATTVLTFTTTTYNNTISHFACDFNGYGNYEWNRNAFLLGQTTVSSQYNNSFTLDRSNAIAVPNGFYLAQKFGTSAITGSWASYPMGTSVTQKPNAMGFEYDYNPITYKIKYNLNGGTNNSSNPSTYDVLDSVYLKNPTCDGYIFEGWYGDVLDLASSADKRSYLYVTDSVSFVNNVGGNVLSNTKFQIFNEDGSTFLYEPVNTKVTGSVSAEYTHTDSTGWYSVRLAANGSNTDYSYWTKFYFEKGRAYDISWTQETVSSSQMVASNLLVKPSSSGKIVMTNSVDGNSFGNTKFQIRDQSYNFLTEPVHTTVTGEVKAQYTHTYSTGYYKICFGANGSTSDTTFPINVYLVNGRTYDISWTQEKVSSSEMIASNLKMQGIISSINPDAKVDFTNSDANELNAHLNNRTTGDITLTAHWLKDIISYTVTYNPNGGESAPESQTKIHGIDLTLSSVEPTRNGYMFMGWNTKPDNSGYAYPPGSIYTADESVTLYAQWNVNIKTVYKVKHWLQNIDGDASLKDSNNYTLEETESFTNEICGDVNLDGYVNAFDLTELRKILLNASVNSEVQAASDINGDSVVDIRDLVRLKKYLAGLTDATVTPVVKYYTGFTSPSAQSVTVKPDGSTVVNYYYTRNSYTVTVNKENGISSVSGAGTYLYGASVTIDATICSGYTWSKWSGTHSTETQKYTFTMPAQNVVDTASATPNSYKVEYNGNGSTGGSTPSSTHVFDVEKALNDNGFTRSGHKFTGWNTKADGSGTAYADKEVVKNLTYANGETVVLYAQWINVSDAVYKQLTLIALDPNAPYREKTDVITSYWIVNSSDQDCIPTDDIKVKFTVYNINGDLLEQVTKTAIVPANDKNLLYFKWRVPTDLSEKDVIIKAVIIANDSEYGVISKSYATIPYLYYSTPDTQYEEKAPDGFSVPSVPTDTGILQAKWWEYKYENGTFEKVHYGIGTKLNLSALTAPNSLSAVISNGKLTLRSGYGFRSPFSAVSLGIEGYTVPDISSYTSRQYAFALFPEFNYTFGENKCKTMREIGGLFNFGTAADELTDHYIPLYYPDGEYTFKIVTSDSWTPAGMITTSELQTLNVSGTLYDDHYIGRK